jgi:hypothetical protein
MEQTWIPYFQAKLSAKQSSKSSALHSIEFNNERELETEILRLEYELEKTCHILHVTIPSLLSSLSSSACPVVPSFQTLHSASSLPSSHFFSSLADTSLS